MKKLVALLLALTLVFSLVGCVSKDIPVNTESGKKEESVERKELELSDTLKINFAMGNNARTMTYQQANPLTLPDGKVITQGDLKPIWQYIESQLGFDIIDVTIQDQKAQEMIDLSAATGFKDAVIFGGENVAGDLMNYGAQGYFIDLNKYLDYMPHVKEYLEKNPNFANAITAYNGGIYHLPYVAEINNFARVFAGRPDWVTALLDSTDMLEKEKKTIKVSYQGFWKRHNTNVIELQNAAAKNGKLDQATALQVLVDYIKATYPELEKPSDLYLGLSAKYDIDELVALWRVIELSPRTLSKVTVGKAIDDVEISAFFVRKSEYREDVLRLLNYFDGQQVHTSDSYAARLFAFNGEMSYTYADKDFIDKLVYIKAMKDEGLIHSEFADRSVKDEYRKSMYFSDKAEGQKQFGFMTYDWTASTTAGSDKIHVMLPPVTTMTKAGIKDYIHYVGNTRVIKPDGWAISAAASEKEINSALKLFDYMFTKEGNIVQNYSIPEAIVAGEKYQGPDGIAYPKFGEWLKNAANEYKNGDISGFLRDFMGAQLPIGYQKEIGFEYQYTTENGFAGWKLYNDAHVLSPSYETDNAYIRLMPPIISLNDQELAKLETVTIGETQVDAIFQYIVGAENAVKSPDEILALYKESGIDKYIEVYAGAYKRMVE